MWNNLELYSDTYVKNGDNMIYKLTDFRQLQDSQIGFLFSLELVAGYDYINPDYNNVQGYVSKENFVEDVHSYDVTFYPLSETLKEALSDNDFEIININDYTIHQFKGCEE